MGDDRPVGWDEDPEITHHNVRIDLDRGRHFLVKVEGDVAHDHITVDQGGITG